MQQKIWIGVCFRCFQSPRVRNTNRRSDGYAEARRIPESKELSRNTRDRVMDCGKGARREFPSCGTKIFRRLAM